MNVDDNVFCFLSIVPVRSNSSDLAEIVTQLLFGEVAVVIEKHEQWIKIRSAHDRYEGWIDQKQVVVISPTTFNLISAQTARQTSLTLQLMTPWGPIHTVMGSLVDESQQSFYVEDHAFKWISNPDKFKAKDISSYADKYMNAPYLWGGRTPFGIDCSGFTQAVFRFVGVQLPRDASQQVKEGNLVNFTEVQIGDLAFFQNSKGKVTHVGMVLNDYRIIHASGRVRVDELKPEGIFHTELNKLTHQIHSIKRFLH